ncbi:MAG TPA: GYD domain-containing protein [Geomonas sp.]|nr:GYD domain-containing protein [Geomonas sp.]
MSTYLIEFSFTQKGVENIKESPARFEAAKRMIREQGGEVLAFYASMGSEFDTLFIMEAPDEKKAGEMALAIAKQGYVRTRTHRLFDDNEFKTLLDQLR